MICLPGHGDLIRQDDNQAGGPHREQRRQHENVGAIGLHGAHGLAGADGGGAAEALDGTCGTLVGETARGEGVRKIELEYAAALVVSIGSRR